MPAPLNYGLLQRGVAVRPCAGITQIRFYRSVANMLATLSARLPRAPLANYKNAMTTVKILL